MSSDARIRRNTKYRSGGPHKPLVPGWLDKQVHLSSKRTISQEFDKSQPEVFKHRDLLHFILSYPVKPLLSQISQTDFNNCLSEFKLLKGAQLKNGKVARSMAISSISCLDQARGTYLPRYWGRPEAVRLEISPYQNLYRRSLAEDFPRWAVKSAIRQASQCILEENMNLISISGEEAGAGAVASAFPNMPEIQSNFDIVLHIHIYTHQDMKDINKRIEEQTDKLPEANPSSLSLDVKTNRIILILDCLMSEDHIDPNVLKTTMDRYHACVVLVTHSENIYKTVLVDMDIRLEYHLLPLELFVDHAQLDYSDRNSARDQLALNLLEQCHGDLVAVVLLATELSHVKDVGFWKVALGELKYCHSTQVSEVVNEFMIRVFMFIWKRKDPITKLCTQWIATHSNGEQLETASLVSSWLRDGLVQTEREGTDIVDDLTQSNLLEFMTMRQEIRDVLLMYVIPSFGLPLTARAIVDNAETIDLRKSGVAELPDSPNCPSLVILCLQNNCHLMMIPPLFFKHMPVLSTLNLSFTNIKTLPASISALVSLRRLFLRNCKLFLELPSEIGQLSELEWIDLEGTKVMCLPKEISQLKKLRQLKVSFYTVEKGHRRNKQRIPKGVLSNLSCLEVLLIGLNPDEDDAEWVADVQNMLLHPPKNIHPLTNIMLYVPETRLLEHLSHFWSTKYILVVGRCGKRMISRIPYEVEEKLKQHGRYLQYVNGECIPTEVKKFVKCSDAFVLDRHWTVKRLSDFGTETFEYLKSCFLVDCKELQTILYEGDVDLFGQLEYLGIQYMKNLRSICSGKINTHSLLKLRHLTLCTCTSLNSLFTISLLSNLLSLEELAVEDCPKIESLVTQDGCAWVHQRHILPNLKKMSLLELPELVNISNSLKIAPKLEKLIIFYCPKLGSVSEVLGGKLNVVKGETEWWESLPWQETDPLASIFVPLKIDGDLMTQFTEE